MKLECSPDYFPVASLSPLINPEWSVVASRNTIHILWLLKSPTIVLGGYLPGFQMHNLANMDSDLGSWSWSVLFLRCIMPTRLSSKTLQAYSSVTAISFQCISWINPLQLSQEIMTRRNKSQRGLWAHTLPRADNSWLPQLPFILQCCQIQMALKLILPNSVERTHAYTGEYASPFLLQADF